MYVIFTGADCKWCDKAKALLTLADKDFYEVPIQKTKNGDTLLDYHFQIWRAMGFTSVPQVFNGMTHIGGFEALTEHLNNSKE